MIEDMYFSIVKAKCVPVDVSEIEGPFDEVFISFEVVESFSCVSVDSDLAVWLETLRFSVDRTLLVE